VNPWRKLVLVARPLAEKVWAMRPPKIRVVADGRVLYWALAVPTEEDLKDPAWLGQNTPGLGVWLVELISRGAWPVAWEVKLLGAWLVERLVFLEEGWPDAREVKLLGVWAGNPPRLEFIARAWIELKEEEGAVDA
jgi:hypothetical protein